MTNQDEEKDLYKILGVPKKSSQEEIKSSFRKLARKYHQMMKQQQKNLKIYQEHIQYYQMNQKEKDMINME